uniref:RBR-type E3 ubiquitin transferase n=1 Tax=Leersia perrieri TaxID=77586 RepID=A0A0D9VWI2_9ORYZ
MARDDDEQCYYDCDDDDSEEEDAEWIDGLESEDDDDDLGLVEEADLLLPEDRRADCWAITQESLPAAQQQDLSIVMNLLNIKQHQARTLLIHHRWNMHSIYDSLDRKGRDRMLWEACIILQKTSKPAASGSRIPTKGVVTCNVCFEDFSVANVSTMDCGHGFCNDCWTEHFFTAIKSVNNQIRCMEVKCKAICDEDIVQRLLDLRYPAASKRFNQLLLVSYLDDNDSVKFCPSAPHCGRAIQVSSGERHGEVTCPCGVSFCFSCAGEVHSPCPCAMWDKWKAKAHGDSDSVKWILKNTKSCPKCLKPIEKIDGCNQVRCKCGHWLCGGPTGAEHTWTSISGHSCNRYKEEEQGSTAADKGRRQMQRYTHYWDRYNIHAGSHKVEQGELARAVAERARRLESDLSRPRVHRDGAWLGAAHARLLSSRQVLSRSYAFAYYMFGGGDGDVVGRMTSERASQLAVAQNLFEDQQEVLENHVEHLSKELADVAADVAEEGIVAAKMKVVSIVKVVQTICEKMYGCIQDELLPLLQQDLSMVMNLLCIKQHQARALLIHHRWNVDSILDYLDRKGPERMLKEAGIVIQEEKKSSSTAMPRRSHRRSVTCNVCFEDVSPFAVSTMDCGHGFCNDCWTEHFFTSVNGGQKQIRCMEVKCPAICDEEVVQRLLGAKYPAAASRLDGFLVQSYVEDNDAARWCPSAPHCGSAVRVDGGREACEDVVCPCGVAFCFGCGASPPHSPCPCAMWERWGAYRNGGELANLKWIVANTKSCPKCSKPIQKIDGCNHVVCTCGQHLCYACGAATGMLYMHECNRYKEGDGGGCKVEMTANGRELLRYKHYYDRFELHTDSHSKEQHQLGPAVTNLTAQLNKAAAAADTDVTVRDAEWPAAAAVLPRSYVLAYYMFGGGTAATADADEAASLAAAQNRFEDLQG